MANKLKYGFVSFLVLAGCALVTAKHADKTMNMPKNEKDFAKTAVMITSNNMRSGGTGVILSSRPGASFILTNKHVCQLVQVGGKVIDDAGNDYNVESFRVYKKHDLCLVTIFKNLGVSVRVAEKPPEVYSPSIVVGHPALLPTMVTPGHFSQWRTINLIVDMKECDGTEKGEDAMMCVFTGGKPVTKEFSAQATSSLIMPGSSGSGVFNEKGELAGLVFAGSEGLSYGYIVPWEYIHDFLTHLDRYPAQVPNSTKEPTNFFTSYFKFDKICSDRISYVMEMDSMCKSVASLGLWHE